MKAIPLHLKKANNFQYKACDITKLITSKTRAIMSWPGNPTGGVTEKKELEEIFEIARTIQYLDYFK